MNKVMEKKTFEDLRREIQQTGLCGRCGGCVSFCSAGRLGALEMGEDGLPRYADKDNCLECGICYLICPQTGELDQEAKSMFGWRAPIGRYETITSARSTDEDVMKVCTDGGVVTSLLASMLERGLIDGAVVSRKMDVFSRKPIIATSREDLLRAAGTEFSGSTHMEKIGEEYSTYAQMVPAIRSLSTRQFTNLAVVGTPCQIMTIRKMQVLRILPADAVKFTVGLFCMENFSFDAEAGEHFAREHGVDLADIVKMNVKEDVILTTGSGEIRHIPFSKAHRIARPGCLTCQDFSNEYADLSVGGLGSPDGYTTVLLRTEAGRRAYRDAMQFGSIEERPMDGAAERERMLDNVVTFAKRKRRRGQRNRRETLKKTVLDH